MDKEKLLRLAILAKEELVRGELHESLDCLHDLIDALRKDIAESKK